MNAKKAVVSKSIVPAGTQPLADEDLGSVVGGHGERKRRTTGYRRRTTRRSRKSHYGKKSWF
jgi:hypothetical protein